MKHLLGMAQLTCAIFLATAAISTQAQAIPNVDTPRALVGIRFAATRANSPPGSCGCFYLKGAALDAAIDLSSRWSAALEIAGNHASTVPTTSRALSTITLMAGPRYTQPLGNRSLVLAQALFGAVRGFDESFPQGTDSADTATGLAVAVGAGYQYRLTSRLLLLPAQVDYVQTNLPNGADGRQRNLRFSAGLRFRVPLGRSRR